MRTQHIAILLVALCSCRPREDDEVARHIESQIRRRFKDPGSVRFRNTQLFKSGFPTLYPFDLVSYTLCGEVNANYTGYRRFRAIWLIPEDRNLSADKPPSVVVEPESGFEKL